jgi:hypothetical protein
MTAIRLDMTMSLDGFVAGPDDRPGQETGQGGFRLFNWLDDRDGSGPNGEEPPGRSSGPASSTRSRCTSCPSCSAR